METVGDQPQRFKAGPCQILAADGGLESQAQCCSDANSAQMTPLFLRRLPRRSELNFICSSSSVTTGCINRNLLISAGASSTSRLQQLWSVVQPAKGSQNEGGESHGLGQRHRNMKELVDIYCFRSQSELWTQSGEFLAAHLQSNVVHTPLILIRIQAKILDVVQTHQVCPAKCIPTIWLNISINNIQKWCGLLSMIGTALLNIYF